MKARVGQGTYLCTDCEGQKSTRSSIRCHSCANRKKQLGKPGGMEGKYHSDKSKELMSLHRAGTGMTGKKHKEKSKIKMKTSHQTPEYLAKMSGEKHPMFGKHPVAWSKNLTKETDTRVAKLAKSQMGHIVTKKVRKKMSQHHPPDQNCKHHRDLDRNNENPKNIKFMTRLLHNQLHGQMSRRGTVFVRNAMNKGIVTKEFYEQYLSYINQEDKNLSEINQVSEKITLEMIN